MSADGRLCNDSMSTEVTATRNEISAHLFLNGKHDCSSMQFVCLIWGMECSDQVTTTTAGVMSHICSPVFFPYSLILLLYLYSTVIV